MTVLPDVPRTARERARAEITGEILATAREHLARDGAAALSLRAIARDLGMVSSAVYRYVPNRDALLTMLIIDAYDTVGAQVEQAAAACPRADYLGRFLATCRALRAWALANPHEYALIYGSPVPGYAAPVDTIAPASRVPIVLLSILFDLTADGAAAQADPVPPALAAGIAPFREFAERARVRRSPAARARVVVVAARHGLAGAVRPPPQRRRRGPGGTVRLLRPPDAPGGHRPRDGGRLMGQADAERVEFATRQAWRDWLPCEPRILARGLRRLLQEVGSRGRSGVRRPHRGGALLRLDRRHGTVGR